MDFLYILATAIETAIGPIAAVYALAAIGLNLHFGYTGLLNFGQVGFMLVGGYGVAVSVSTFGLPLWAGVLASIGCAVLLALLLGIPTLRLRADYLSICTIAVAEVARLVYRAEFARDVTGGVYGLQGFASAFYDANPFPRGDYGIGDISFSARDLWMMIAAWGLVLVASVVMWLLIHSPWGRVIKGIREDEEAVRSLGKNVFAYKMQSLVLGGVFGALAGALIAVNQQTITPDQFMPQVTFYLWAMLLLGGAGRTLGPVLGAVVMWFLLTVFDETLRSLAATGVLPFLQGSDVGALRHAMVGLALLLLIVFRPQGIIGNRKEMLVNVK
ncbi:branched-chain amino acid ABC transporter permease [Marinitenerispora sediminis]|uniref:Branched-chain amino acid ABC transporter permease n=1 Tax=Marinitenerispora sediminis TaxID=1931232 RepID=A0A368TAG6_9ACTN|nr:branched-chain amino acid ABC transporter permease [Marinitenerispora sediminis]RCV51675.1 branched-chain amino acid ABC transporter permease [Marinitenerispora sediminis]RCV59473.1 branched-chain amino acid ABC transporter permease [Marinitenerispora sediminis]RCV61710.1 branched-chain amino acid ABC transporter permease [Marinitenerispora sediminis]